MERMHRKSEKDRRKAVSYTLHPDTILLIEAEAKKMKVTKSAFVSYVFSDYFARKKDGTA